MIEIARSQKEEEEGDLRRSRYLYDRNHTERIEYIGQTVGKINCYIPDTPINYCNYDGN